MTQEERQSGANMVFVHGPVDGVPTTLCGDCIPPELSARLGDDDIEVWEEGSHGWTSAPICQKCHLALPVYIDGIEST